MDVKRWLRTQWDRAGAWTLIAVGAIALVIGWSGASNTPFPAEQIPYVLSGGIGGALLVGLGAALLLSADARDEWQKLDRIERALLARGRDDAVNAAPAVDAEAAADEHPEDRPQAGSNGAPQARRRRPVAAKGSRR